MRIPPNGRPGDAVGAGKATGTETKEALEPVGVSMLERVTHVSLIVRDQQEALDWYTDKFGFEVVTDTQMPEGNGRWLTVAPPSQAEIEIVLEPLTWGLSGDEADKKRELVGSQGFVFAVDQMQATMDQLRRNGVTIVSEPEETPWGISALVEDLYGNVHNLVQPRSADTGVPDVA